jgi:hypothetical protein
MEMDTTATCDFVTLHHRSFAHSRWPRLRNPASGRLRPVYLNLYVNVP